MKSPVQFRQLENLIAFKAPNGKFVAFHSGNLEVAGISPESWDSLEFSKTSDSLGALLAWSKEHSPLVKSGRIENKFTSLTLNVTQICNLHCTYCAAGGDGTYGDPVKKISVDKTLPQLGFFLGKLAKGDTFHLTFLGGEPLIYPEAIDIIGDYVKQACAEKGLNARFTVVTNATLINEKAIQVLTSLQAEISISLDGPAAANDLNRVTKTGKGTTATVMKGLLQLKKHRSQLASIGVSGVFGSRNLDVLAAFEFYQSLGVDWFDFTYDHMDFSEASNLSFCEQMAQIGRRSLDQGGEQALRKIRQFDHYFDLLDEQQRIENFCGAGKSFLMIDARNNIYVCPWMVGNSKEMVGAGETLFQDKLKTFQEPLIEKHGCQSCWAKYLCGGGCMFIHSQKNGDKHKVDEHFCERTRFLIAQAILFFEECRVGA